MSRLRDAEVTVYRTDLHGDVTATSDGNNVSFKTQKNTEPIQPRSGTKAQMLQTA
jgi:competence protein ComEC